MRMKNHEHFGQTAVSVEDILTRVFTDVDDPIEVLSGDVGGVHIYSSVLRNQGQSVKV